MMTLDKRKYVILCNTYLSQKRSVYFVVAQFVYNNQKNI